MYREAKRERSPEWELKGRGLRQVKGQEEKETNPMGVAGGVGGQCPRLGLLEETKGSGPT